VDALKLRASRKPYPDQDAVCRHTAEKKFFFEFNLIWVVQPPLQKYSHSLLTQITCISVAVSPHWRGGSRSSRTRGGMRWTRHVIKTNDIARGRRSRVVLTPRRWRQVLEKQASWGRWWQTGPVTRESAEETVKTIARGMPGVSGVTVVTCLRAFYFCTQGCGRVERSAFPAPSHYSKGRSSRTTRTRRVARRRRHLFCHSGAMRSIEPQMRNGTSEVCASRIPE
jgi:hypothetical protein